MTFEAWENRREPLAFPQPDLLTALVDLYFENVNIFTVLLHRPSFMKDIEDELHLYDYGFRQVVLLVCANGARFSEDPRVFIEGDRSLYSAGWKWFTQVDLSRKSLLASPTLYDLQMHCVSENNRYATPPGHGLNSGSFLARHIVYSNNLRSSNLLDHGQQRYSSRS